MPLATKLAERRRLLIAIAATLVVLAPLAFFWQRSLVPDDLSAMAMGYADYGGGPAEHAHHGRRRQHAQSTVGSGRRECRTHGPQGEVRHPGPWADRRLHVQPHLARSDDRRQQGDLVQVTLHNESVTDGVTLHWHGVDVPAAEDGVAGVTQDAVPAAGAFVYRFVAEDAGTYWYHSHQVSHEQVKGPVRRAGRPAHGAAPDAPAHDVVAAVHTLRQACARSTARTANAGSTRARARPSGCGSSTPTTGRWPAWVDGATYRVVAIDGTEVNAPHRGRATRASLVTAGGRVDCRCTDAGRARRCGSAWAVARRRWSIGDGRRAAGAQPRDSVDLLTLRLPSAARRSIRRRRRGVSSTTSAAGSGFFDGKPGLWWTVNGHSIPDVPMFVVAEGDVVRMTHQATRPARSIRCTCTATTSSY